MNDLEREKLNVIFNLGFVRGTLYRLKSVPREKEHAEEALEKMKVIENFIRDNCIESLPKVQS